VVWGRVQAPSGADDSFWVSVGGGPFVRWDTTISAAWVWDQVNGNGIGDPLLFTLPAGTHTLVIKQREDGARLDRLLVTSNQALVPQGLGAGSPTSQPPAGTHTYLWIEAEAGALVSPMATAADSAASGGLYITTPDLGGGLEATSPGGQAAYTFTVPSSGTYVVWGRTLSPGGGSDSFWVSMDGAPFARWNTPIGTAWVWDQVSGDGIADPLVFTLAAGPHTLVIKQREDGTRLDRLLVTSDRAFVPQGPGDGGGQPPVYLWIEAEAGSLVSPMAAAADSAAWGGLYITTPDLGGGLDAGSPGGQAAYTFTVPTTGTYVVWGRVVAVSGNSDSFWVSMDGAPFTRWNTPIGAAWVWDQINADGIADPLVFALAAGAHTLVIKQREDGTRLDRLLVTSDRAFRP
jgi:hypothetical protein